MPTDDLLNTSMATTADRCNAEDITHENIIHPCTLSETSSCNKERLLLCLQQQELVKACM